MYPVRGEEDGYRTRWRTKIIREAMSADLIVLAEPDFHAEQ
jgi:hypothetical protein